jgi:ATP-dependent Clp protease ATP-binding subunit ClpB
VVQKVASEAYDPIFGARAIDRFIEDKVEDVLVKKIIAGEIKRGERYIFEAAELG